MPACLAACVEHSLSRILWAFSVGTQEWGLGFLRRLSRLITRLSSTGHPRSQVPRHPRRSDPGEEADREGDERGGDAPGPDDGGGEAEGHQDARGAGAEKEGGALQVSQVLSIPREEVFFCFLGLLRGQPFVPKLAGQGGSVWAAWVVAPLGPSETLPATHFPGGGATSSSRSRRTRNSVP